MVWGPSLERDEVVSRQAAERSASRHSYPEQWMGNPPQYTSLNPYVTGQQLTMNPALTPMPTSFTQAIADPSAPAQRQAAAQAEMAGTRPPLLSGLAAPAVFGGQTVAQVASAQDDARRKAAMSQLASSLGGGGGSRPPSVAPGGFGGAPATPTMGARRGTPYANALAQQTSGMAMDKYSPTSGDEILDSELIGGLVGFLI
jgi:hypothetical protein